DPGGTIQMNMRALVCDIGEGYGRLRIHFDPRMAFSNDVWEIGEACQQKIDAIESGFASGTYTCTQKPAVTGNCATIAGNEVCLDEFQPSPIPGISPFCKEVQVAADLDFNEGSMECRTDPRGVEHCPTNTGGAADSCSALESDPQCRFLESTCIEGAEGPNGFCYAYTARYDCGEEVEIGTGDLETTYSCPGGIRCMGTDCVDIDPETSDDFGRAVAMLQAADYMAMDMHCPDNAGESNSMDTCTAFTGEAQECKVAVGGIQDCCDVPVEASLSDYITMMRTMRKI